MQVPTDYLQQIIDGDIRGGVSEVRAIAKELLAARKAIRAHHAWALSEKSKLSGLVSFQAKMELCNYAEHLTGVAMGDCSEYVGVPRMTIDLDLCPRIERCDVENCESLIDEVFEVWRKAAE